MRHSRWFTAVAAAIVVGLPTTAAAAQSEKPVPPPPSGVRVAADAGLEKLGNLATASSALGSYYDKATKQYVITLPADSKATATTFGSVGVATRIVRNKFTTKQVTAAQSSIQQHKWHPDAKKYNYLYYYDAERNAVSVGTNAPKEILAPLMKANPGMYYYHHESNIERDNRQSDPAPHWGGALLSGPGGICSAGFTGRSTFDGSRVMITAGHCYPPVSVVTSGPNDFGIFFNGAYPLYDVGIITRSSYQGYIYVGDQRSTTPRPVYGGGDAAIMNFSNYCRSGATTGEQCGYTVVSADGTVCTRGVCTIAQYVYRGTSGVPSAGGDSGAPFYATALDGSGVFIRGIHTGRGGADHLAERYSRITAAYGVTAAIAP